MKNKALTIILIATLSTLLWVFISLSDEYFTTVELPLRFINLPENMAIASISNEKVSVSLKSEGWQLAKIKYASSSNFVLSPTYEMGRHTYNLRNAVNDNPWITSTMQVTEIVPERIIYFVDDVIEKEVTVIPNVDLSFKDGFGLVGEVNIVSDTVIIKGARSIVENITTLRSEPFEFNDLEKSVSELVKIEQPGGTTLSHNECLIEFDVQKIVDKSFDNVIVQIREVPRRRELLLFPNSITVVLRGGINILGRLDDNSVTAFVSFNQALSDTTGHLVPVVEIPENTTIVTLKPNSLGYIIKQF